MTTTNDIAPTLPEGMLPLPAELRGRILDSVRADGAVEQPCYHLAQMNIARFLKPMDHPDMVGFVEMLDPINHIADVTEGCVWRLTGDGANNAIDITFYDDPLLLVNMSVWRDVSSLRNYVYRTEHAEMVKRRGEWAVEMESQYIVLWWVPAGHTPDIAEGDARLQLLKEQGPTEAAFTFGQSFPPPSS